VSSFLRLMNRRCTYGDTYARLEPSFVQKLFANDGARLKGFEALAVTTTCNAPPRSWHTVVYSQVASGKKGCHWLATKEASLAVKNTHYVVTHFEKPLYTVPETAALLSVSPQTIYTFMKTGQLLAVYPTSKARIPAKSILAFVDNLIENRRLDELSRKRVMA